MRGCLAVFLIAFITSGCALKTMVKGEYYMRTQNYQEGVASLQNQLQQNPDDPAADYYVGRYLLALDRPKEARTYLQRAVKLNPESSNYNFWLGQAYYALGQTGLEQASYRRALALDSKNVQANLYLGHIYLAKGKYKTALHYYQRVLQLQPKNAGALYNRGLALTELGRGPEAAAAWKQYLAYYPQGKWAIRAADHLNEEGDFAYRNIVIGPRRFPVKQIQFAPLSSRLEKESMPELEKIGWIVSISPNFRLEIMAHQKNNTRLAESRARSIRQYLIHSYPEINPARLIAKGTRRPEVVHAGSRKYRLNDSIAFATKWQH